MELFNNRFVRKAKAKLKSPYIADDPGEGETFWGNENDNESPVEVSQDEEGKNEEVTK